MKEICVIDKPIIYNEQVIHATDLYYKTNDKWERISFIEKVQLRNDRELIFTYKLCELNDKRFQIDDFINLRVCLSDDRFFQTKNKKIIYSEINQYFGEIDSVMKYRKTCEDIWEMKVIIRINKEEIINNDTL